MDPSQKNSAYSGQYDTQPYASCPCPPDLLSPTDRQFQINPDAQVRISFPDNLSLVRARAPFTSPERDLARRISRIQTTPQGQGPQTAHKQQEIKGADGRHYIFSYQLIFEPEQPIKIRIWTGDSGDNSATYNISIIFQDDSQVSARLTLPLEAFVTQIGRRFRTHVESSFPPLILVPTEDTVYQLNLESPEYLPGSPYKQELPQPEESPQEEEPAIIPIEDEAKAPSTLEDIEGNISLRSRKYQDGEVTFSYRLTSRDSIPQLDVWVPSPIDPDSYRSATYQITSNQPPNPYQRVHIPYLIFVDLIAQHYLNKHCTFTPSLSYAGSDLIYSIKQPGVLSKAEQARKDILDSSGLSLRESSDLILKNAHTIKAKNEKTANVAYQFFIEDGEVKLEITTQTPEGNTGGPIIYEGWAVISRTPQPAFPWKEPNFPHKTLTERIVRQYLTQGFRFPMKFEVLIPPYYYTFQMPNARTRRS